MPNKIQEFWLHWIVLQIVTPSPLSLYLSLSLCLPPPSLCISLSLSLSFSLSLSLSLIKFQEFSLLNHWIMLLPPILSKLVQISCTQHLAIVTSQLTTQEHMRAGMRHKNAGRFPWRKQMTINTSVRARYSLARGWGRTTVVVGTAAGCPTTTTFCLWVDLGEKETNNIMVTKI